MKTVLDSKQLQIVIQRLAQQLIENHEDFSDTVVIGLQPRGVFLAKRIVNVIEIKLAKKIQYGVLDITFYRDDFNNGQEFLLPNATEINFNIENKKVILIDDVLFTGRTIRSALDAILDFGRPESVELLTLIDRRFKRELPIQPNYVGKTIDSIDSQKVKVFWKENGEKDEVILLNKQNKKLAK